MNHIKEFTAGAMIGAILGLMFVASLFYNGVI